ncbi:MAG: hypothetical protein K2P81_07450 [Bacteriovoracaceae bacterium]|nr:hypothetical protein [Bacteriovoracaceae bacterium]
MLHLLREAYPDADIHFICPEHKIEVLYALPFDGFWHPWKEDEIQTIFDVHRFAVHLNISKVDIYISLGENINELALGRFIGAKKRIGFSDGWKNWFLTTPVKRPIGHHVSEDFYALFKQFTNRRIPEKMQVKGKEMIPFYTDDETPYLAVDLWPFSPGKLDNFWLQYISMHEGKKFVFFFSEEEAKGALLAERFVAKLPSTNKYELFLSPDWIELGKMLTHAKGLVARGGASVSYATYLGTDALAIYETGEPRKDAPIPFYANWQLMDLRDPTVTQAQPKVEGASIKPKPQVDPIELYKKTSEMFFF